MRLPFSTPHCTVGAFNRCCRRRVRIDFPAGKGGRRLSRLYHNPLPAPFAPFSRTRGKGFLRDDDKNDPLFGGFSPSPMSKTGVFPVRGKVNRGKPTEKWCLFLMLLKNRAVIRSWKLFFNNMNLAKPQIAKKPESVGAVGTIRQQSAARQHKEAGTRFLEPLLKRSLLSQLRQTELRRSGASPTLRRRPTCGRRPRSEHCRAR